MINLNEQGTFVPENLITYQEGSVVSRELVKEPGGSITVFAFAKDQGLSEHTTPHHALVQVIDGEATITVDGETYTVASGESLIMPANKPHALQADSAFKMILTMLKVKEQA